MKKNNLDAYLKRSAIPEPWSDALSKLQGHERAGLGWRFTNRFDPAPLSKLLMSSEAVPKEITQIIGRLLNPPRGYIGGRLKYRPPSFQAKELSKKRRKAQKIYEELRQMIDNGIKYESAVNEISKKYGMSYSSVKKLKNLSDDEWADELSRRLDDGTFLP